MFEPSKEFVVFESMHWRVNQRVDAKLPGYLMMSPKDSGAVSFSTITPDALAEMGPVLAKVTKAVEDHLHPRHLYVGRYGHMSGHNLHFHIIPVYDWVIEAFHADTRYRSLRQFYTSGARNSGQTAGFDGTEMTLFIWREFAESPTPPPIHGSSVKEVIELLRQKLG